MRGERQDVFFVRTRVYMCLLLELMHALCISRAFVLVEGLTGAVAVLILKRSTNGPLEGLVTFGKSNAGTAVPKDDALENREGATGVEMSTPGLKEELRRIANGTGAEGRSPAVAGVAATSGVSSLWESWDRSGHGPN